MATIERILIMGGGIAGLSAAVALRRRGFELEIIERSPAWSSAGAGILLHPNGVRALTALGLGEALMAACAQVPSYRILDPADNLEAELAIDDLWGGIGPAVAIHRRALHNVLIAGAFGVPTRMATEVVSLHDRGARVAATFSDGGAGEYDLVIGADGIRSAVRDLAFSPSPPQYVGQLYWRTCIPDTGIVRTWTVMRAERRFLGLIPIGAAIWSTCSHSSRRTNRSMSPCAVGGRGCPSGSLISRGRCGTRCRCSARMSRSTSGRLRRSRGINGAPGVCS